MCKSLVTGIEGTNIGTITSVYTNVSPQVEVERKSFSTSFKCTLYKNKYIDISEKAHGIFVKNMTIDLILIWLLLRYANDLESSKVNPGFLKKLSKNKIGVF